MSVYRSVAIYESRSVYTYMSKLGLLPLSEIHKIWYLQGGKFSKTRNMYVTLVQFSSMGSVASLPLSPEIYSCCTENCGTYQLRNRRITNTRIIPTIFFIELRLLLINCFICCHLVSDAAISMQTDNTNALGKNSRATGTKITVITIAIIIITPTIIINTRLEQNMNLDCLHYKSASRDEIIVMN